MQTYGGQPEIQEDNGVPAEEDNGVPAAGFMARGRREAWLA